MSSSSSTDDDRTRGLPSPYLVFGEALQSIALGILERGDANASFSTRAVGLTILALLLILGSLIASLASSLSESLIGSALTVPVIRADLVFTMISRIVLVAIWSSKLRPTKLLYANEVYPLQAAAIIWNDCKPIKAIRRNQDGHSTIIDILSSQLQLWKPTRLDSISARASKLLVYLVLFLLEQLFLALEAALFVLLRLFVNRNVANYTLAPVQGRRICAVGHVALITDAQLTFIQELTMRDDASTEHKLEARRVLLRSVHVANLFSQGGYTRLSEHACGDHAMSEYFKLVQDNPLIKESLSKIMEVDALSHLRGGNKLKRGSEVPRQIMWARIVTASRLGLQGHNRWRGSLISSLFTVAQKNHTLWEPYLNLTPLHRHIYTVSRRWFIDWVMFLWWEIEIPNELVYQPVAFFARARTLLENNLVHNTISLPYAIGEMAVSFPQGREVQLMLLRLLGDDWEEWFTKQQTLGGKPLADTMRDAVIWKCYQQPVTGDVTVDPTLYVEAQLSSVMNVSPSSTLRDQVIAVIAKRIMDVVIERVEKEWLRLPHHLLDPAEEELESRESMSSNDIDNV